MGNFLGKSIEENPCNNFKRCHTDSRYMTLKKEIECYIEIEMHDMNKDFIERYGTELIENKLLENYYCLMYEKEVTDDLITRDEWMKRFDINYKKN